MLTKLKIFFIIVVFQINFLKATEIDVLLCPYDIGDMNYLMGLTELLRKDNVSFKILPLGKASEVIMNKDTLNVFLKEKITSQSSRDTLLCPDDIKQITGKINPKIVMTGMASVAQGQLLKSFKKSYKIAVYDNFDDPRDKMYIQPFLNVISKEDVNEFMLPSETSVLGFKSFSNIKGIRLNVVGNPDLESWDAIYSRMNIEILGKKLNINEEKQLVLFAGGYDDTYEKYFEIVVSSLKDYPNLIVLVTYHPKTDGSLERSIIRKHNAKNFRVFDKGTYSTVELSTIALVIICHKSSVGFKSLYKGKPVIFVAEPGYDRSNILIKYGLASRVSDQRNLVSVLSNMLNTSSKKEHSLYVLGVPDNASYKIVEYIKSVLNSYE